MSLGMILILFFIFQVYNLSLLQIFLTENNIKSDFETIIFFTEENFKQSNAIISILFKIGGFNRFCQESSNLYL